MGRIFRQALSLPDSFLQVSNVTYIKCAGFAEGKYTIQNKYSERTFESEMTDLGQPKVFTYIIKQFIHITVRNPRETRKSPLLQARENKEKSMKKIYFTLTGTNYYHGKDFLKSGMRIRLIKEPDNPYDSEAIRVEMDPLSKIGYVANSTRTVIGDSWSAGRLYDWIRKEADAKVMLVTEHGVLCRVCKKSVRSNR